MALPFASPLAAPSSAPVEPPSVTFPVRGREVTLTAMGGDVETGGPIIEWGEMHLLAGQELLTAFHLARQGHGKDSPVLRSVLRQMVESNIARVCMCSGLPVEFVVTLSEPERLDIIDRQNQLNGITKYFEAFAVGQIKASYAQQSP